MEFLQNDLFSYEDYKNSIIKVCDLVRDDKPLISEVEIDEATNRANLAFDYSFDGQSKFYPFKLNSVIKNLDFQILVITGASGS